MRILISNDDGINAGGIHALVDAFKGEHEVIIIAPDSERSGFSHSATIFRPFSYVKEKREVEAYAVSGTPADCVKLGVLHLLKGRQPDLVLSGINSGPNLGSDIMYSGTVAAASEGVFLGIPAIAVSLATKTLQHETDSLYSEPADFVKRNLDTLYTLAKQQAGRILLNINYPKKALKGAVFTKTGINSYIDYFDMCEQNGGCITMQLKGEPNMHELDKQNCDVAYIRQGYATITPLQLDRTNHELVEQYKSIKLM